MLHRKRNREPKDQGSRPINTTVSRKQLPALPTDEGRETETERGKPKDVVSKVQETLSRPLNIKTTPSQKPSSIVSSAKSRVKTNLLSPGGLSISMTKDGKPSGKHSRTASEDVPLIVDSSVYPIPSAEPSPLLTAFPSPPPGKTGMKRSSLDKDKDTVLGIVAPGKFQHVEETKLPPRLIPELQALAQRSRGTSNPPVPSLGSASSPSTRLTESPAPWSASPTTSTPVSWPSSSPGIVQHAPVKTMEKRSNTIPQPNAGVRSRLPKLPNMHEATKSTDLTTSMMPEVKVVHTPPIRIKRKPVQETPPPLPPLRSITAQGVADWIADKSGESNIDNSSSKQSEQPVEPFSSTELDLSPSLSRRRDEVKVSGEAVEDSKIGNVHDNLQRSISTVPKRPSREGTVDLGETRPAVMNKSMTKTIARDRQLLASAMEERFDPDVPDSGNTRREEERARLAKSQLTDQSPGRLGKLPRLGLFTKPLKSPTPAYDKSPQNSQRRGPTAGTGHEGYGKYGRRSRKKSDDPGQSGSDSERSRSNTRRVPLLTSLRKGSNSSSRIDWIGSSDRLPSSHLEKRIAARGDSQMSFYEDSIEDDQSGSHDYSRENLPSNSPRLPAKGSKSEKDEPQPVRDTIKRRWGLAITTPIVSDIPPLALRRSQKFGPSNEGFRIPTPIRTEDLRSPLYITSHDTSQSSAIPPLTASSTSGTDLYRLDPSSSKSNDKKSRRQWWNPFKRPRELSDNETRKAFRPPTPLHPEMAVDITSVAKSKPVPYYVMMDSENENSTTDMLGSYLSEAIESAPNSPQLGPVGINESNTGEDDNIEAPSPIMEDPAHASETSSPITLALDPPTEQQPATRKPRLARVGRIPKVVTRSERQHYPSRTSFSQPFGRRAEDESDVGDNIAAVEAPNERPVLEIRTDTLPSRPFADFENISAKPASAPARTQGTTFSADEPDNQQTFRYQPKQLSDISTSASSEGPMKVLGPPMIPNKSSRRVLRAPKLDTAFVDHGDDEIWNEYDDFIDHVMSPSKSPEWQPPVESYDRGEPVPSALLSAGDMPSASAGPSFGFQSSQYETQSYGIVASNPAYLTPPTLFSPDMYLDRGIEGEIRLRRSRIISALHSSIDPSSPFSMREFLNEYGERYRDSLVLPDQEPSSTRGSVSQGTLATSALSRESINTKPEPTRFEKSVLLDVVERTKNPVNSSELHYASLEVARWLSFGRVLFSPAHEEIHTLPERHVLVIDGLGNEDWSIYCAVTYESQKAIVYNLKENAHAAAARLMKHSDDTPANHERAETKSLSDRFPFHSSFFSAIVLRFPPAMSEAKLRNIIAECRRTLVPGGHLEVMLLDLDIVNMGVQTRRAMRELKMRMTGVERDVSLRPVIDHFQTLLGGQGFSSLNRCVVGVPVAGRPSGVVDSSSSSRSSRGSNGYQKHHSGDASRRRRRSGSRSADHHQQANLSLNDLVADHSENADAKIGKMVSSTARSWWQHCFEASVIRDGDLSSSIFADKRIVRECKSRASSFKLLIAYAQRPVFENRRRTMSEPVVPTLATAGNQRAPKTAR